MKLTSKANEASFNRKKAFLLNSISKIVRDKAQIVRDKFPFLGISHAYCSFDYQQLTRFLPVNRDG